MYWLSNILYKTASRVEDTVVTVDSSCERKVIWRHHVPRNSRELYKQVQNGLNEKEWKGRRIVVIYVSKRVVSLSLCFKQTFMDHGSQSFLPCAHAFHHLLKCHLIYQYQQCNDLSVCDPGFTPETLKFLEGKGKENFLWVENLCCKRSCILHSVYLTVCRDQWYQFHVDLWFFLCL